MFINNFLKHTKAKVIILILFFIDAAHTSIGKIINADCGDSMGLCAPAPGAILWSIISLFLLPIKIIMIPILYLIAPIVNLSTTYFEKCEINYSIGGQKCYVYAFVLFLFLSTCYYLYPSLGV